MEQRLSSPQPLPLPSHQGGGALKAIDSFKSGIASVSLYASGPAPDVAEQDAFSSVEYEELEGLKHRVGLMKEQCSSIPQPLHLPPTGLIRNFTYEEIAAACHNFSSDRCMSERLSSTIYSASFGDDASSAKKFEATVTRLHSSTHGLKEFINEVNTLASLQHPHLCKLLGFHACDGSEPRMLVYERLCHGSLDRQLFGRSDGSSIDWNSRMKIAMYNEFSAANIQIDEDFSAKLSGYGCVGRIPEEEISSSSCTVGNLSVETLEKGILTPKSNVWSFGIVLLELLTGRKNLDSHHPKEERNLVNGTRTVADIAQRCLHKEPSERPTMRTIVEHLETVQDLKYSCRFPLQEPAKEMSRSPSLNGIICHAPPRLSFSPSAASVVARPSVSSPRWSARSGGVPTLHLPLHACSSSSSPR
ncbi:hypothetical protein JHK86_001645 [Glycine max]|nr:hypothetical protein JHK86_001645 [Glycine max]